MVIERGKNLLVVITLALVSVAACANVSASNTTHAAPKTIAAQPAAGGTSSPAADLSVGARIYTAVKTAASEPHGEIGDASVATSP